jgi:hypothetical protein
VVSILAGIVDRQGGIRVVVTARENIHFHVNEGERLYVVPHFVIDGEVPYEQYVGLIDKAIKYVMDNKP